MIWSIILLLINLLNFWLTPLEFSFIDFINEDLNLIIKKISLIFFLIDISIQLNLGIYENFEIMKDRKRIFIVYLK